MAKGEDITTKFKVDISDLKKGITEANNQIRLANSEFKKSSAGMDSWAKSTEGIKAKLTQLKSVLEAQNSKLKSYQEQLKTAQKYEKESSSNVTRLREALAKARIAYGENSTEVKKLQSQLTQAEKAEIAMKNQVASLTVTMNNQEATVRKTEKEMDGLESSLKDVEKAEKIAAQTGKSVDDVLEDMGNAAKKSSDGFTVMKGALAGLIADGIRTAISSVKSLVGEAISASDALYKFEQTMGFAGYDGATIKKAKDDVKQYADETVYDLDTISNTTAQLAANGIKDYTGLTQAAGNLNAVAGGNADTFKSVAMVMTQTAGAGKLTTENWNQLANAIPGASGKLQEALLQAGAYTGNFREAMEKGEITAEEFNAAIMTLGNEPVAVEAAKSVQTFEGAVGNMQAAVVSGLMEIIDTIGMENITGFINNVTSGIQTLIPIVKGIVNFFIDNGQTIIGIVASLAAGTAAYLAYTTAVTVMTKGWMALEVVQKAVTAAQWLMNAAMSANPIGIVIGLITALVAGFVLLWNKSEGFRNFWIGLWENIKSACEPVIKAISEWFSQTWDQIKAVWDQVQPYFQVIWDKIKQVFEPVVQYYKALFETAWNAIKAVWDNVTGYFQAIWDTIKGVFSVVKSVFSGDWQGAWDAIKGIVDTWKSYFEGVWENIKHVFDPLINWFTDTFGGAWEKVKEVWGIVADWFNSTVIEPIKNFFSTIAEAISGFFKTSWEATKAVWSTVANWFNTNVVQPIKNFFQPLVDWFSKLWKSISDFIKSVFDVIVGLAKGCVEAIKLIWGVISEWFNTNIIQPVKQFFTQLWEDIKAKAQAAWDGIKAIWTVVSSWFNDNIIQPVKNFFTELWDFIKNKAQETWDGIVAIWEVVSSWFKDKIIEPVSNFFKTMWEGIKTAAENTWNGIKNVWNAVTAWFNNTIINPVKNAFTNLWNTAKTGASNAWAGIKSVFSSVASFFRSTFETAWTAVKNVFSTGGKIFDGIKEGIVSAFKNIVNGIINGINKVIKVPFDGINNALNNIRNIDIAGAKPFGGLPSISVPQIPNLATGIAKAKKGHQYLLEGKNDEAVIPLHKNAAWLKALAGTLLTKIQNNNAGLSPAIAGATTNSNVNNFTQNIYAPKQPSRIELYRQTRNLLNLKGGY